MYQDLLFFSFLFTERVPCISHTLRGTMSLVLSRRCLRSSTSCSWSSGWDFLKKGNTENDNPGTSHTKQRMPSSNNRKQNKWKCKVLTLTFQKQTLGLHHYHLQRLQPSLNLPSTRLCFIALNSAQIQHRMFDKSQTDLLLWCHPQLCILCFW